LNITNEGENGDVMLTLTLQDAPIVPHSSVNIDTDQFLKNIGEY